MTKRTVMIHRSDMEQAVSKQNAARALLAVAEEQTDKLGFVAVTLREIDRRGGPVFRRELIINSRVPGGCGRECWEWMKAEGYHYRESVRDGYGWVDYCLSRNEAMALLAKETELPS